MTQEIVELFNFIERLGYNELKFSTKSFFKPLFKNSGKVKSSQTQMIANKRMLMIPSTATSWSNE